ncbi:MAG: hypothetical protein UDM11_05995 [Oscillospiraceae bacterium]|nr:hypothetical protein [Oscillospiraceae bacterium]
MWRPASVYQRNVTPQWAASSGGWGSRSLKVRPMVCSAVPSAVRKGRHSAESVSSSGDSRARAMPPKR